MSADNKPLLVHFKDDTRNTVTRETLRKLVTSLGLSSETQAIHVALARLRDSVLVETEEIVPLTEAHHQAIAKAEPVGRGKVVSSLLEL
jgi:hypothetical protein